MYLRVRHFFFWGGGVIFIFIVFYLIFSCNSTVYGRTKIKIIYISGHKLLVDYISGRRSRIQLLKLQKTLGVSILLNQTVRTIGIIDQNFQSNRSDSICLVTESLITSQQSRTGNENFWKLNNKFRLDQTDRSKRTTSEGHRTTLTGKFPHGPKSSIYFVDRSSIRFTGHNCSLHSFLSCGWFYYVKLFQSNPFDLVCGVSHGSLLGSLPLSLYYLSSLPLI